MGPPGAAEALLRLQHDEARARALRAQVVGAADPGDAGADDEHVEIGQRSSSGSWRSLRAAGRSPLARTGPIGTAFDKSGRLACDKRTGDLAFGQGGNAITMGEFR